MSAPTRGSSKPDPDASGASLRSLLVQGTRALADTSPSPGVDSEQLLLAATGVGRARLFTHPETPVSPVERERFREWVARRVRGEPIAYILGRRGFWTLDLAVDRATLIPRPETELLVETALAKLAPRAQARVLDLGTGSGAVAIALACERPQAEVHAVERSPAALATARRNAAICNATVHFHEGSWFDAVPPLRFDVVVSNPPYIAAGDPHLRRGDLRYEPSGALVAGPTGLECLADIIAQAPNHLSPGALLALEHGHDQAEDVTALFRKAGFSRWESHLDLQGHMRVSAGYL